ncbi:MAG: sigma-70 family RNA polymerase sigma factor [Erysipelotrichia bacterium]|nr:sigma-70 family RNA polymerase sigma factor [Erysipelotrichia bacterium]
MKKNVQVKETVIESTSLQALSLYRRDLSTVNKSDPLMQAELIKQAKQGNMEAAEQLISAHLKLVYKTAAKYSNNDEQLLLDLIQEGNLGLVIAMQKFNPEKGRSFTTYALFWIEKYIFSYLNANRLIRIPTRTVVEIKKLKKVITDLQQQLSHYPTISEIAKNSCFSQEQIKKLMRYDYQISSLDEDEAFQKLAIENDKDIDNDIAEIIIQFIDNLEDCKDKNILKMYLGIGYDKSFTFQQIGDELHISRQAVRARYIKTIKKIKEIYD